ncbi:transposase, partial [Lachnospiraceae bacterium OttesenSCG-928-D06]|nr:transposase [Lachnospiraceae bacterium OttesenSCG-928-D06]
EFIYRKTLVQIIYHKLEDIKLITKEQYEAVLKQYPELSSLYNLVKEFNRILFSKKPEEIGAWIKQAEKIETLPELLSYVGGLKQDLTAVKNAILYDYNNGLAEGSVTKIKLIKRIMYGRNSFELLKSKVLLHELLYGDNN